MSTPTQNKATGRGQLEKLPDGSTLLFNFDIDSSVLKSEHIAFLLQNVLPAAKASPGGLRVVIGGSADRLGDAAHNVALSNRRIQAVADFLKQKMPGYRWDFQGFGQGVGEDGAARSGDADGTRDDIFRNVIIEILKPGQPVPRKPNIPKSFPKKPGEFKKVDVFPDGETLICLREDRILPGTSFDVRILTTFATTVFNINLIFLVIRDLQNQLAVEYELRGVDATTDLPFGGISPSETLQVRSFQIQPPGAKVTDFTSATIKNGLGHGLLSAPPTIELKYKAADGQSLAVTSSIDLGSFGKEPHLIKGILSVQTTCVGGPGANKLNP